MAEVHRSNERSRIVSALTGFPDGLVIKEIMAAAEVLIAAPSICCFTGQRW